METILVTGATGTVGSRVIEQLRGRDTQIRAAVRSPERASLPEDVEAVAFDFEEPETWGAALKGVDKLFLIRPPAISRVGDSINPAIDAAARVGVDHIVYLSVLGAEKNPLLPHHRIEDHLREADLEWTFLRASFFMENLSEVHGEEIRDGEIVVPAGEGTTSFVAAGDIAAVAAAALTESGHEGQAYGITGPEALTYHDVAARLSDVLDWTVTYTDPSLVQFARHSRSLDRDWSFVIVMSMLYTTARLGLAGRVEDDIEDVLGRSPQSLREWIETNVDTFDPTDTVTEGQLEAKP